MQRNSYPIVKSSFEIAVYNRKTVFRGLSSLPPLGPYAAHAAHAHLTSQQLQLNSPNNSSSNSPTHSYPDIKAEGGSSPNQSSSSNQSPTGSPPTQNGRLALKLTWVFGQLWRHDESWWLMINRSTTNFMTHLISHKSWRYESYFANFWSCDLSLSVLNIRIESLIQEI